MGLFSKIMDKIFHHERAAPAARAAAPAAQAAPSPTPTQASAQPAPVAPPPVDVVAVLTAMAEMDDAKGGNWQSSIVDLLKLLKLDSSLDARKELAEELGVNAGAPGSAEQNIALHKAVMRKMSENGGLVPDSFYA